MATPGLAIWARRHLGRNWSADVTVKEWRGIVAVLLMLLAFVLKSRAEEERMGETFPEYEAYRRESSALIPFVY
jgi:protein-S-isoprenylcysteine O-methyltransferase Ste14